MFSEKLTYRNVPIDAKDAMAIVYQPLNDMLGDSTAVGQIAVIRKRQSEKQKLVSRETQKVTALTKNGEEANILII